MKIAQQSTTYGFNPRTIVYKGYLVSFQKKSN